MQSGLSVLEKDTFSAKHEEISSWGIFQERDCSSLSRTPQKKYFIDGFEILLRVRPVSFYKNLNEDLTSIYHP